MIFYLLFFSILIPIFIMLPVLSVGITFPLMTIYKKYGKTLLLVLVISISLPILRYSPFFEDDSSFHYLAAFEFSKYADFSDLMLALFNGVKISRYDYANIPIYTFLLYIFSDTYTYSLVSFCVCIITYYCYSYVTVDLFQKETFSKLVFVLVFLGVFLANNYRYTTSGMRYCMAMAILMLLLYWDSIKLERRSIFLILYLIPLFIHPSSIFFIGMRFIFWGLKKITLVKSICVFLIFPFLLYLVPLLANISSISYLQMFADKLAVYANNDSYEELFTITLTLRLYVGVLIIILFLFVFCYFFYKKIIVNIRYSKFIILTYYYSLLSLGTFPFRNIYDRNLFLLYPMIIISTCILLMNLKCAQNVNNIRVIRGISYAIFLICLVMGVLYNKNFPLHLLDYSITRLLTTNIFNFFDNLPIYY